MSHAEVPVVFFTAHGDIPMSVRVLTISHND
jgi:FixJ family two-component response regulator